MSESTDQAIGWPCRKSEMFFPAVAMSKFPYKYLPFALKEPIAQGFWTEGKFWGHGWDVFYMYEIGSTSQAPRVLLVLEEDAVLALFDKITHILELSFPINRELYNSNLKLNLYETSPVPAPRFLGTVKSNLQWQTLQKSIPGPEFRPELKGTEIPTYPEKPLEKWMRVFEQGLAANSKPRKITRERKQAENAAKRAEFGRQIRRCQRYLGLRHGSIKSALKLDVRIAACFTPDYQPVFICIDVEAYEKNHSLITEIGVASLDTHDLQGVPPGDSGNHWRRLIHARHFRIREFAHLENMEYLQGCSKHFDYGKSEIIPLGQVGARVKECFTFPFANVNAKGDSAPPIQTPRNIIFVGHDAGADINYLRSVGVHIPSQRGVIEVLDTALMHRFHRREPNNRSLASMCYDFGITPWHMHNAGNDAMFTLQAMMAVAVHAITNPTAGERSSDEHRIIAEEVVNDALEKIADDGHGWTLDDADNGGPPVSWPKADKPVLSSKYVPAVKEPQNVINSNKRTFLPPAARVANGRIPSTEPLPFKIPGSPFQGAPRTAYPPPPSNLHRRPSTFSVAGRSDLIDMTSAPPTPPAHLLELPSPAMRNLGTAGVMPPQQYPYPPPQQQNVWASPSAPFGPPPPPQGPQNQNQNPWTGAAEFVPLQHQQQAQYQGWNYPMPMPLPLPPPSDVSVVEEPRVNGGEVVGPASEAGQQQQQQQQQGGFDGQYDGQAWNGMGFVPGGGNNGEPWW